MCVCMYVFMYVYMYIYMCVCVYVPFLSFSKVPEECENEKLPVESQENYHLIL